MSTHLAPASPLMPAPATPQAPRPHQGDGAPPARPQLRGQAVTVRMATRSDLPVLAEIEYLASIPPFDQSIWSEILAPARVPIQTVLEAMLEADASRWGRVEDFVLLEVDGTVAAGCAVFAPDPAATDHRPLVLERLDLVATRLGWSAALTTTLIERYLADWTEDAALTPHAPTIIESVAVLPSWQGLGLGDRLMQAAFDRAQALGSSTLGISVIHGNTRAERLYRRWFEPVVSYHAAYFNGQFPGLTKLRAPVPAAAAVLQPGDRA